MSNPAGWDERDYKLWSRIQSLPSFGLIAGNVDNPMLSLLDIIKCIEAEAAKRRVEKAEDRKP